MSVVYKCFLALVLAAGVTGSASAVTWKMDFFDDSNVLVGTGTFTTAGVPTLIDWQFDASNWTSVVNGTTYLPQMSISVPQIMFECGETVATFILYENGNPGLQNNLVGSWTTLSDGTIDRFWGLPSDCDCTVGGGTYTLSQVPTVDRAPSVVPLPASAALLPLGLGALALVRRRRRSQP